MVGHQSLVIITQWQEHLFKKKEIGYSWSRYKKRKKNYIHGISLKETQKREYFRILKQFHNFFRMQLKLSR